MIDPTVYAGYMTAIADRLKFPLADATNALYYVTLSGALDTQQFEYAARKVFADYDDFGFPPPSVFLAALKTAEPRAFDVEKVIRQIDRLGIYSPTAGRIPALVGDVRRELGDVVADAYASIGGARLFADDSTTRSIAARDFGKTLTEYQAMPDVRPLLPSPPEVRKISPRNAPAESIASIVSRALPEKSA